MSMFKEIPSRGWLIIAVYVLGAVMFAIAGFQGAKEAALIQGIIVISTIVLLQLTRTIVDSLLPMTQELIGELNAERDFAKEVTENYLQVISDLRFHDKQRSLVHYHRLRESLRKRHPELAQEVEESGTRAAWGPAT